MLTLVVGCAGLLVGPLATEPAEAAACGTAVPAGTTCTATGTLTLAAGALTLTSPASLTWAATLTGANLTLVDATTADQQYTVSDATGTGAGWHVTVSATTFTNGTATLPNSGTFVTTGSVSSISATTAPTAACAAGSTCTLPTDGTTYPVAITTAATTPLPVTVYDTAASTGLGNIVLGGSGAANPVGWWLNVPASAKAGSYTSTITQAIVSAP